MPLLFLVLLCFASNLECVEYVKDTFTLKIENPTMQDIQTRKLKLENGLHVYLISDPQTDEAGAALCVEAGNWDDPKNNAGMAHFLEHMLFLGTKKYPEEGQYAKFITENGGRHNAYTANNETVYGFTVVPDAFSEALDRFGHFFIDPLFNPSGVEREMHAVDQEYKKGIESDGRRFWGVLKSIAHEGHPFTNFGVGSLETLQSISQADLKNWYRENYSANQMHLAVQGKENLDVLEKQVVQIFSKIVNTQRKEQVYPKEIFPQEAFENAIHIESLKDQKSLSLIFPIDAHFAVQKEIQPETLVGFALGHESEGSLLYELKKGGLAESLSSGGYHLSKKHLVFVVNIGLTQRGVEEQDLVIARFYQYVDMLKKHGIPKYVFDEIRTMATMNYAYQTRGGVYNKLMSYASSMKEEPLSSFPRLSLMPDLYDNTMLQNFVAALSPKNTIKATMFSPKYSSDEKPFKEKHWHAEYSLKPFEDDYFDQYAKLKEYPYYSLPKANLFIPESLRVKNGREDFAKGQLQVPDMVKRTESSTTYFLPDKKYSEPKVVYSVEIFSPAFTKKEGKNQVLAEIYLRSITEKLNALSYQASLANLYYKLSLKDSALNVRVFGYSDKAPQLLYQILETLKDAVPSERDFNIYHSSLTDAYLNFDKESPLLHGFEKMNFMLHEKFYTQSQKLSYSHQITYGDYVRYAEHALDEVYIRNFFGGNITRAESLHMARKVSDMFSEVVFPIEMHEEDIIADFTEEPIMASFDDERLGASVILSLQHEGPFSFKKRAAQELLARGLSSAFYKELRTKQQTGYIVGSHDRELKKKLFQFFYNVLGRDSMKP